MEFWISKEQWNNALNLMERLSDPDIFYRFIPILLNHLPSRVIQLLVGKGRELDPSKLIPSFVKSVSIEVEVRFDSCKF
jgi:hypothetical protein